MPADELPYPCHPSPQHYLDHHLAQPLMRLFEPILKNPKELLTGAGCCGGGGRDNAWQLAGKVLLMYLPHKRRELKACVAPPTRPPHLPTSPLPACRRRSHAVHHSDHSFGGQRRHHEVCTEAPDVPGLPRHAGGGGDHGVQALQGEGAVRWRGWRGRQGKYQRQVPAACTLPSSPSDVPSNFHLDSGMCR